MLYRDRSAVCSTDPHKTHKYIWWAEVRIFKRGRTVTTNAYQLRHVHPPACPQVSARIPLNRIQEHFTLGTSHENQSRNRTKIAVTLHERPSVYCWQRHMQSNNRNGTHCCVFMAKVATRTRTRHTITL